MLRCTRERSSTLYGYIRINGEMRINQAHAEAIREIIKWHDAGYSYSQIEYLLHRTKHRTITGKKFYPAAIQTIIKNRKIYEGETGYPAILGIKAVGKNKEPAVKKESTPFMPSELHETAWGDQMVQPKPQVRRTFVATPVNKNASNSIADHGLTYKKVDDFLPYVKSKGIRIKDNRWNDGCVWVQADPQIDEIISKVKINGRGFKYTPKCRAFEGKPGWYY